MKKDVKKRVAAFAVAFTIVSAVASVPVVAFADWAKESVNTGNVIHIGKKETYVWAQAAQDKAEEGIHGRTVDGNLQTDTVNLVELFGEENLTASFKPEGGEAINVADPAAFAPVSKGELTVLPNKPWYTNEPLTMPVSVSESYTVKFEVTYPAWYKETFDELTVVATPSQSGAETPSEGGTETVAESGTETPSESATITETAVLDGSFYKVILPVGTYDLTLTSLCFRMGPTTENVDLGTNVAVDKPVTIAQSAQFTVPRLTTTAKVEYTESGFNIPRGNTTYSAFRGPGIRQPDGSYKYFYLRAKADEGFVVSYKVLGTVSGNNNLWLPDGGFCFKIGQSWYTLIVYTSKGNAETARIGFQKYTSGGWVNNIFYGYADIALAASTAAEREIETAFVPADSNDGENSYGAFYIRIKNQDREIAVRVGAELLFPELFGYSREGEAKANGYPVWISNERGKIAGKFTADEFFGAHERLLGLRAIDSTAQFTDVSYRIGTDYAKERVKEMRKVASKAEVDDKGNAWPAWTASAQENA